MELAQALAHERWLERLALARAGAAPLDAPVGCGATGVTVIAMGGTIDKDYPRSAGGYAFEIDEPAAGRVLGELPANLSVEHSIISVCRKDSTEIDAADRQALRRGCNRTYPGCNCTPPTLPPHVSRPCATPWPGSLRAAVWSSRTAPTRCWSRRRQLSAAARRSRLVRLLPDRSID